MKIINKKKKKNKWTKLYDIWKHLAVKSAIKSFNIYVALTHEDYYFF